MSGGLNFAPLLPWPVIAALGGIGALLLLYALIRGGRGVVLRAATLGLLVLVVLNPRIVNEDRKPQTDVAVVVVDQSSSQGVGGRKAQTEAALEKIREGLARFKDLETRVIRVEGVRETKDAEGGTRLFGALGQVLTEIPKNRFGGAIVITDGQIHDVPKEGSGPLHVLLTGAPGEKDRRVVIDKAPGYGIVGRDVTVVYRVEDHDRTKGRTGRRLVKVIIRRDGQQVETARVPVGRGVRHTFKLEHAGPTVVEVEAEAVKGELSALNNKGVVSVNGVRDRLRVLLVSGQPHAGERTWRNLLKSDPSVDLIHFTILRPPEKNDFTPLRELALIAFPVQELFETKLKKFDLIVFDRYIVRDVLPPVYMQNIVNYLREGGALMFASGPGFSGPGSLFLTSLGAVIPAQPTGKVLETGFVPRFTDLGRRHPVTAQLASDGAKGAESGQAPARPPWGRWFRQVETKKLAGVSLMQGVGEQPLLILNRVKKGRIAQLTSDHIWLWARGFEGGGPHGELLRRVAHWLMKEPDLEEEGLTARTRDGRLVVERRSLEGTAKTVKMTTPSGASRSVKLSEARPGLYRGNAPVEEAGLYRIEDGTKTTLVAVGALNPLELADMRATAERLAPLVKATGGGVNWIRDGIPDLRRTQIGRDTAGRGWIGLRRNKSFVVAGVIQVPLLPGLAVVVLVLGLLMAAWWREGH